MHEWMVRFTPQREWIEGKGIYLWLAFFTSEIGASVYFVSLLINFPVGWVIGWVTSMILGGVFHILYLGNPTRAWRMLRRPFSSELSRGLWIFLFFAVIGGFHSGNVLVGRLPWLADAISLEVIIGVLCVLVMTHGALVMSVVKALPLWNSPMLVIVSTASILTLGSQTTELVLSLSGYSVLTLET